MYTPSNTSDVHHSCYFSISPPSHDHFSAETPYFSQVCSPAETPTNPTHPLLATTETESFSAPSSPTRHATSSFLQMQTAAAHSHPPRPRPVPVQNVLHVTTEDSTSSDGSFSSTSSTSSSLDLARCSRCQRTPSIDVRNGKSNMVQYGLNLWYCSRCAAMVGLINR